MSLQNEIDALIAKEEGQRRKVAEDEHQKEEDERRAQFVIAEARIPALITLLEDLKCKELLEQVWNEIWKRGKIFAKVHQSEKLERAGGVHVTPYPSLATFKLGDPIMSAEVGLRMGWSHEQDISDTGTYRRFVEEFISIEAYYIGERICVITASSKLGSREISDPDASKIRDFVVEDCARRREDIATYDEQRKKESNFENQAPGKKSSGMPIWLILILGLALLAVIMRCSVGIMGAS